MYIYLYIYGYVYVHILYIYKHIYIYIYIYKYVYIYIYIIELCQQIFIYNEEGQCTSRTSSAQVLELPQSYFGDDWEGKLFS